MSSQVTLRQSSDPKSEANRVALKAAQRQWRINTRRRAEEEDDYDDFSPANPQGSRR